MKKKSLRERKEAFKKAYYEELTKINERENNKNKPSETEKTKAQLIEEAESLGLQVNSKMTKAQIIELIGG